MDAAQLNDLRQRVLNNQPFTDEELAAAIRTMVGERALAVTPAEKSGKKKSPASTIDLSDLV